MEREIKFSTDERFVLVLSLLSYRDTKKKSGGFAAIIDSLISRVER